MTSLPPRWALTPPFHPCRSEIPGFGAARLSACQPHPDAFTGGCFLLRSHDLTAIKPLACVVLCVARTFLSRPAAGSDRADLRGKDKKKCGIGIVEGRFSVAGRVSVVYSWLAAAFADPSPSKNPRLGGGLRRVQSGRLHFGRLCCRIPPLIFNCPFLKGFSSPTGTPCRADSGTAGRNVWA